MGHVLTTAAQRAELEAATNVEKAARAKKSKKASKTMTNTPSSQGAQGIVDASTTGTHRQNVHTTPVVPKVYSMEADLPLESLVPAMQEIERFADWFNGVTGMDLQQKFTMVIQTKGKRNIYGHANLGKFRKVLDDNGKVVKKDGKAKLELVSPAWTNKAGDNIHELMISSEDLNREPMHILETVGHELMHLANHQNGISDCSQGGRHNKNFQSNAILYGMEVIGEDKVHGFAFTDFTETMKAKILAEFKPDAAAFALFSVAMPAKAKQTAVAHRCPLCEGQARAKPSMQIGCYCSGVSVMMVPDALDTSEDNEL